MIYFTEKRAKWQNEIADGVEARMELERLYLRDLLAYNSNAILLQQGCAEKTAEYAYYKRIHQLLEVKQIDDNNYRLVRLGKEFDGGYIVSENSLNGELSSTKVAYSLGISDDVSFDLELEKRGYEVFQYDHSIEQLPEQKERFHWKKLGITGEEETEELKHLETVIRSDGNSDRMGMLLKCDIEGYEWGMITQSGEGLLDRFDQIVIEFHDITDFRKRQRILNALENISKTHQAIHVHANNNGEVAYSGLLVTPDVLEVTFANKNRFQFAETEAVYPFMQDQPCNPDKPDILLGQWNVR